MKRWTGYFIKLLVIGTVGFLFSCASIQHQQIESRDAVSYDKQGLAYMKGGTNAKAPSFGKTPERSTLLAVAFNNRGMLSLEEGKQEQAILDFNKATEIDPMFALPYNNRARVYTEKGDYDRAILNLDKALEIDPGYTTAYFNRAVAYYLKGEYVRFRLDVMKAQQAIKLSSSR
jgi:tetratricopeptide (TPR) repeat protein